LKREGTNPESMQVPGLCLAWQGPSWGAVIAGAGRRRGGSDAARRAGGAYGARSLAVRAVLLAEARRQVGLCMYPVPAG